MDKLPGVSIVVASDPEYDQLITEISYNEHFLCLLSQDNGLEKLEIIFQPVNGKKYGVPLELFLQAIELARADILKHSTFMK